MSIASDSGFSLTVCVGDASPHKVKLAEKPIDSSFTPHRRRWKGARLFAWLQN